jgi:hypothetical protein
MHVGRDRHEQLGAAAGELPRRLGELDVEADEWRDHPAGELGVIRKRLLELRCVRTELAGHRRELRDEREHAAQLPAPA